MDGNADAMILCIVVSRAFQVLSDPDKRSKFDKFGGDPDNRFASSTSAGESPFSGFGRSGGGFGSRGGQMFEEEISPEEMFRQFFGGGMGGFGAGPFGMSDHFRSPTGQAQLGAEADGMARRQIYSRA